MAFLTMVMSLNLIMRNVYIFLLSSSIIIADIPDGYYDSTEGLTGQMLRSALHNIIDDHIQQSYGSLHDHFELTDRKSNNTVWDMYSDVPGGSPAYVYNFTDSDQCGNYSGEGDCYNREHSWPQSWFNSAFPMKSDLFHVYPTDGYVNSHRGSYPYGDVGSASWTSTNGSKKGSCLNPGYSGTVFEPIDAYKGDIARTYFYMSTRYFNEDNSWDNTDMTTGADLRDWAVAVLLGWHHLDPVSEKEIDRNDAVYDIQENRNPYIDHPEWVECIWGNDCITYGCMDPDAINYNPNATDDDGSCEYEMSIGQHTEYPTEHRLFPAFPNPFNPVTTISFTIPPVETLCATSLQVYDINGKKVKTLIDKQVNPGIYSVHWNAENHPTGIYNVKLTTGHFSESQKLILLK